MRTRCHKTNVSAIPQNGHLSYSGLPPKDLARRLRRQLGQADHAFFFWIGAANISLILYYYALPRIVTSRYFGTRSIGRSRTAMRTKIRSLRSIKKCSMLSRDAKAVLELLRPCEAKAKEFVFEPMVPRKTLISKIRRDWRRAVKNSGIAKVRFHDLRHTALTRLVLTGTDLRTVKDIAGHSSLKTTQRYLHSSDKLQQAAVERLSSGDFGATFTTTPQEAVEQIPVPATIQGGCARSSGG